MNFELVCFVDSTDLNGAVAEILRGDIRASREVTIEDLNGKPRFRAVLESAANLFSPLL